MIRVLLVDDHDLFRHGIRTILERSGEVTVLGEARDGLEAIRVSKQLAPDIILMDINMPVLDGIKATEEIRHVQPGVKFLVLSLSDDASVINKVRSTGAEGFMSKSACCDDLITALHAIQNGHEYYPDGREGNGTG